MNTIVLVRPDESVNTAYDYPIEVDGKHRISLQNNAEQALTVEDNNVIIQARNGWGGSNKKSINFTSKDSITLQVTGNTFYNRAVRYIGAVGLPSLAAIWFIADQTLLLRYSSSTLWVALLLYLIYTLTVKRNSWLLIDEIDS